MFDLYEDESARTMDKAAARPSLHPEPGMFSGGLDLAMQGLAKTARAVDLAGAAPAIAFAKLTGNDRAIDKYFAGDENTMRGLTGSAVDYWTPSPGEVGTAGRIVGGLVPVVAAALINPALAIGAAGLGTGEDLVKEGVPAKKAIAAAVTQAVGLGVGISMPFYGSTLATKALLGGATNVAQGVATKAVTKAILSGEKSAEQFNPWDVEGLVLDTLMGFAFGGIAHLGAKGQEARDALTQTDRDAILASQQARHMEDTTAPGRPEDAVSATAHVQAVKQAADDLLSGRPVNVDQIVQDARFAPDAAKDADAAQVAQEIRAEAERMVAAYHGSPHNFEKFDLSKIGTGEGAQAYGHGLYFAESPEVAGQYQKRVTEMAFVEKVKDAYDEFDSPGDAEAALRQSNLTAAEKRLIDALRKDDWLGFDYPHQAVRAALREPGNFDLSPATKSALDAFGNIYRVEIPEHVVDRMLDWDKPLSEQPDVLKALQATEWLPATEKSLGQMTGQDLYRAMSERNGQTKIFIGDKQKVADYLREQNIPGIKYLDQGSRQHIEHRPISEAQRAAAEAEMLDIQKVKKPAAVDANEMASLDSREDELRALLAHDNVPPPTRNFVLFDAEHARIVEKNGQRVIDTQATAPIEPLARNPEPIEPARATTQGAESKGESAAPPDPLLTEARQRIAEHGDVLVTLGTDEKGKPITRTVSELMDEHAKTVEQARADASLFQVAAECMIGGL